MITTKSRAQARKDSLFVNTSYYTITDDENYIEVAWKAATSPGANNGELTLWIDGDASLMAVVATP